MFKFYGKAVSEYREALEAFTVSGGRVNKIAGGYQLYFWNPIEGIWQHLITFPEPSKKSEYIEATKVIMSQLKGEFWR